MDQLRHTGDAAVDMTLPAVPESVPAVRRAVAGLAAEAGANDVLLDAVRLASSEAVTNAVVHAYEGSPGTVHVHAEVDPGGLSVSVTDDGLGLRPRINRRGMGLGLALIAEATQELAIVKRPAGGTELQMRFGLSPRS